MSTMTSLSPADLVAALSPADAIAYANRVIEAARANLNLIEVGDRVTWVARIDEDGTVHLDAGKVSSIDTYGGITHARIDTDTDRPWALITTITLDKLTRLPNPEAAR